jgi:hypothetical protein
MEVTMSEQTVATLNDQEREALPDWTEENSFEETEFKIDEVEADKQRFWVKDKDGMYICFNAVHIDPDSEIGAKVSEIPNSDRITMSGVCLRKNEGAVPDWFLTEIYEVRSDEGTERNPFRI